MKCVEGFRNPAVIPSEAKNLAEILYGVYPESYRRVQDDFLREGNQAGPSFRYCPNLRFGYNIEDPRCEHKIKDFGRIGIKWQYAARAPLDIGSIRAYRIVVVHCIRIAGAPVRFWLG